MTDLLHFLPSDEEDGAQTDSRKADEDDSHVGDNDNFYEINDSFQFGGVLGEDGGSYSYNNRSESGWSYRKVLEMNDDNNATDTPARMDVISLIQAKRRTIQHEHKNNKKKKIEEKDMKDDDQKDDDENDKNGCDDDESDEDESSTDEIEFASNEKSATPKEEDVLKTRESRKKKKTTKITAVDHDENDQGVHGDVDDNDSDDEENDYEDEINAPEQHDEVEAAKAAGFFESTNPFLSNKIEVFTQLTLSRPLLKGIAAMGFVEPTPIQASVIPLALAGRDICASAVTGSGKTAAFVLPVLERLLHRQRGGGTKALILTPTRELAAQCISMMSTFMQHISDIRSCLIVGGTKNVNAQAAELRTRPDIIVATPGRLLDHVTNSAGVSLDDVEFLVLDEADRLLDLGFQDEIMELIKSCPINRQTLLFSATMTTKVDDLIKLSLKRPVRIHISEKKSNSVKNSSGSPSDSNHATSLEVAPRLDQEFIRIRPGNEGIHREAILLSLLTRTFTTQTIVFFDTKVTAHRLMILCGLIGIKCTELHGNLTQQQRLQALEEFRCGDVDILLATDLAARGLDIDRVKAVINFEMPTSVESYVHRIGRTARAGRCGRSCTLISEPRRHLMKDLIKDYEKKQQHQQQQSGSMKNGNMDNAVIRTRTVPPKVIAHFVAKIESLEGHVEEVLQAEAVAKMDRIAEMELTKAQNLIEHEDEIKSRPQREWYKTEEKKQAAKAQLAEKIRLQQEKAGTGMHRMTRKKRRAREALEAMKEQIEEEKRNQANDDDEMDEELSSKKTKKQKALAVTPAAVKASARKEKREHLKAKDAAYEMSIYDHDREVERKLLQKTKKKMKTKAGADPVGDGSLFDEEKITYALKTNINNNKKNKKGADSDTNDDGGGGIVKSSYNFRGFDPNKKLGKLKGHKAFKSKSKFKRRK